MQCPYKEVTPQKSSSTYTVKKVINGAQRNDIVTVDGWRLFAIFDRIFGKLGSGVSVQQDSKVSKGCAVLIELVTLRNTKELSVFNDIFSLSTNGL